MNIRKKILFNPSHIKSAKPDTSDTTTAHTKNSAILEQSKTFRFSNQKTISTRRQRNYLRTLSKDPKQHDFSANCAPGIKNKNIIVPSFSTMSNENFMPVKKSAIGRKFFVGQNELPSLVPLKRTDLMTSQQERKLVNYPSSLHVSSNKEIMMRELAKKQSNQQEQQQPRQLKLEGHMILGQQLEQIERRKQKLNSLNVASFYTTQKSIALSKYSVRSRENHLEGRVNSDKKPNQSVNVQKDQMLSRFASGDEEMKMQVDEVKQSPQKGLEDSNEELQESIAQEIEKNQSMAKERPEARKRQEGSSNEWSETLKSSFAESDKKKKATIDEHTNSNSESSLCESEVVNSQQVRNRKETIEVQAKGNIRERQSSGEKEQDDKEGKQVDSEGQSLCESYQVETPQKNAQ